MVGLIIRKWEIVMLQIKCASGVVKSLRDWLKDFSKMTYDSGYLWMSDDAAKFAEQVDRIQEVGQIVNHPGCEFLTEIMLHCEDFSDLPVGTKIYVIKPEK